ncbi:hypothetical protein [Embleya sp. NPDC059237]|uniref:hypothetical protein n=1 Tax=Embleya sp. NPDC059237 TaxID=3346784 RepID=UPI0036BD473F
MTNPEVMPASAWGDAAGAIADADAARAECGTGHARGGVGGQGATTMFIDRTVLKPIPAPQKATVSESVAAVVVATTRARPWRRF